jgi:predicted LPLAT superfamily acyltransferase
MSVERREHWSNVRERGDVVGLQIMYTAYRWLGRWAFTLLLYPVVAYFCVTASKARKASRDYLQRVRRRLQERNPPVVPRLNTFRHLLDFGNSLLDKAAMWAGAFPAAHVEFDDPQVFKRLRDSGRGAMFIGSHLGNLEVLRAYADVEQGLKVTALVLTRNSPKLNRLIAAVGSRALESVVQIDSLGPETVIKLQDKIRAGEHVAITADRVSARHRDRSIHVPFLGRPAPFPEGPFILASLLSCPVYLLFCLRIGKRYKVFIEPFADPLVLPRGRRREALERAIAQFAARLEARCLMAPTQWFNFFDFWDQAEADAASRRE